MMMRKLTCGATVLAASVCLVGCGESATDRVEPTALMYVTIQNGHVFFTQNRVPEMVMEAVFTGTIEADDAGCLRAEPESESAYTFVWPKSYVLDTSEAVPVVLNDQGERVAALGEEFTFGGGVVEELLDSMGFTEEDRTAAEACPGRFWIVSPPGV